MAEVKVSPRAEKWAENKWRKELQKPVGTSELAGNFLGLCFGSNWAASLKDLRVLGQKEQP